MRFIQVHRASQLGVKRGLQERQRPEPFDPAQSRFDVKQRGTEPVGPQQIRPVRLIVCLIKLV